MVHGMGYSGARPALSCRLSATILAAAPAGPATERQFPVVLPSHTAAAVLGERGGAMVVIASLCPATSGICALAVFSDLAVFAARRHRGGGGIGAARDAQPGRI